MTATAPRFSYRILSYVILRSMSGPRRTPAPRSTPRLLLQPLDFISVHLVDILLRRFRQLDRRVAGRQEDDGIARRHDGAVLVLDPDIEVHLVATYFLHLLADLAFDPIGVAGVDELAVLARQLPQPAVVAHPVGDGVGQKCLAQPAIIIGNGDAEFIGPCLFPVHALDRVGYT